MKCCVHCFQDDHLVRFIEREGVVGSCDFCSAEQVKTINAHDLGDTFEPLLELYEPAQQDTHITCETLAECIEGWEVFSEELDTRTQNNLLDEIKFGGMRYKRRFEDHLSSDDWAASEDNLLSTSTEDIWKDFATHLKHKRRFLPKPEEFESLSNPNDWLPEILAATASEVTPESEFFRAREGSIAKPIGHPAALPAELMGAPPPAKARRNRANPAGISYLYVAEDEKTSLAEIRTFVGAKVSICRVRPQKKLTVADLTKADAIGSPFRHSNLSAILERNTLLSALNEELARPVNPEDNEVEYVPTQYLAEVILNAGYDGIRYKSAATESGTNLVFFRPEDLDIQPNIRLVEVLSIEVTYR